MGKFGIGARVSDEDGDEGVIVGKRKGERLVNYDRFGLIWVSKGYISPLPANDNVELVAPERGGAQTDWQPKVGDRVRLKSVNHVERWGRAGEEGRVLDVGSYETALVQFDVSGFWCARANNLEPLPVAAEAQGAGDAPAGSLTIQPGKFYRTRDGRKVGPMRKNAWRNSFFSETREVSSQDWLEDGSFIKNFPSCLDLIAEWVDEPAEWPSEDPVAVAPAAATPAFKVGDHIRVKDGELTGTIATRSPGGFMSFITDGDTVAGPEFWLDDELEIAERAFKPGAFANLRVKVTSVNGQKVNVIIPGLRNPSHGVPLSELSA